VKRIKKITDILLLAAVILSVIFFILDDCSRFIQWNVLWKKIIAGAVLLLDIIFSIDFIVRIFKSTGKKAVVNYFRDENGWADFANSLPPLFIGSVPTAIILLSGQATLCIPGFFCSLAAARISGTLRLFRIIKFFTIAGKTDSKMAGHHISLINTLTVTSIIFVFLLFSLAPGSIHNRLLKERSAQYLDLIDGLKRISDMNGIGYREASETMLLSDKNILRIVYTNGTVIEKFPDPVFRKEYNCVDYIQVAGRACTVFVSVRDIGRVAAVEHIQVIMIIIFTVIAIMFIYSVHFTRNISDVIRILNRGFRKKDYNLLVKIPEKYSDHEVFRLSKFYNDAYLPAKMKKIMDRENLMRSDR
jgi:hypothetical protein